MVTTSLNVVIPKKSEVAPSANSGSIVDYLKSTGGASDFGSRTDLAVKQGIVGSAAEYTGSASQNTALLNALRTGAAPAASVGKDATSIINQNQEGDIANTPAADDAPTRDDSRSSRYATAFSDISGMINPAGDSPAAPNYTDLYNKARGDYNIDDLENYINDLQTEEDEIFADLRQQRTAERGKTVAQNVIEGKIGEEERAASERTDYLVRQKNSAVRQLQGANAAIENMINFTKLDYETARTSYNDQFSQQMSLFNTITGVVDSEMADEEREASTARANLNIIYDSMREGEMSVSDMTPQQKYDISKMELSAGLPTGFYENITNQNPDGKILSTTTRTSGGAKYADVLMKGTDGSISVKSVYLGAEGGGTDVADDSKSIEAFRSDAQGYILDLEAKKIGWGGAFNALKAKYPQASNETIDAILKKDTYYNVVPSQDNKQIIINQ